MDSLIRTIRHFITLRDEEEAVVTGLFMPVHVNAGEFFLEEGKICRSAAFIEKGLMRYFMTQDGNEKTIYFSSEGEFVCNYSSFLPAKPSDVSIQALEETVLYVISYDNLQRLYSGIGMGERFGRMAIEQVFVDSIEQLRSLYTDTPTQRYQHFLEAYPNLVQRIPQYYIASYVGIKPQSLSRIRKRIAAGPR